MIDLYSWNTSNGRKVAILLEELGLPYRFHPVDIGHGEQFHPAFQTLNPNGKIPAIYDADGPDGPVTLFESGAILVYLAEKTGSDLWPSDPNRRMEVLQWLMWQMGGVGPMFGQALHFLRYAQEDHPYARERYHTEAKRLFAVLDARLEDRDFIVDAYSIADIAVFPWVLRHDWMDIDLADFPNVQRWFERINARPAVQRGLVAQDLEHPGNRLAQVA